MNENRKAENKYLHGETEAEERQGVEWDDAESKSYESKVMDGMEKK